MVNPIPRDERLQREREEKRSKKSTLRITSVSVTLSRTIQVRQFEPVRVDVTQTAEVTEHDNPSEVRRELYEVTSKALRGMMRLELDKWKETE
jgi:hypothetical protein